MRYLIIGGGVAGTSCAEELHKLDPEAEVTIVSEENHPLYSRVLLPHYAMGKVERAKCFLKTPEWYQENQIELLSGTRVIKLDPENKFVEIDSGRELSYDKLLIASGTEPRTVSDEPRGVTYFWTIDDTDHLLQLLNEQGGHQAAVFGGGFIACEFLNVFKEHGVPTTLFCRGEHFWRKTLNEETSKFFEAHLEKAGVKVMLKTDLAEMQGDKELTGIKTTNSEIDCSILGVAVGVEADLEWVKEAEIEAGQGIKTNEFLETNAKDVYAAGDVAETFDPVVGRQYRAGNWTRAMMQGRVAAKNMFGERTEFRLVSSYAINVLGMDVTFIGDVDKQAADKVVVQGSADQDGMTQIFLRENKVVGAAILGQSQGRSKLTKAIENRLSLDQI